MSRKMRTERARSLYNSIGSNSTQQAGHVDYEMFTSELDRYLEKLKVAQRELELKLSSVKSSMVLEEDSNSLFSDTFEANGVADTSFEPVDDEESTCELKSDQYDKMRLYLNFVNFLKKKKLFVLSTKGSVNLRRSRTNSIAQRAVSRVD